MSENPPTLNYANPSRRKFWTRPAIIGFSIASGTVLLIDVVMIATMDLQSDLAAIIWNTLNFVSMPFVFIYGMLVPPPFAESEPTAWDYTAIGIALFFSCLIWGLIGAFVSKGKVFRKKISPPQPVKWP